MSMIVSYDIAFLAGVFSISLLHFSFQDCSVLCNALMDLSTAVYLVNLTGNLLNSFNVFFLGIKILQLLLFFVRERHFSGRQVESGVWSL